MRVGQPAPQRVGRFELHSRLQGGACPVYLAEDADSERVVDLRLYPAGAADPARELKRLLRATRPARELRHPGVVPVLEVGSADGTPYVAAEHAEGPRLAEVLGEGPLRAGRAAAVARDLADALAHAHERGFVYGAVHPSSIVLDPRLGARWLDFGAAGADDTVNPAYQAPEQLDGSAGTATPASDQYGLGIVLYEMLCGRTPFTGDDEEVVAQIRDHDIRKPRAVQSGIPRDVEAVCLKALAQAPEARYPSCRELADDLRRWLDDSPVEACRPGPFERWRRWMRKAPVVATAVSLLLIAGAGVAALAMLGFVQSIDSVQAERNARMMAEQARAQGEDARRQADQAARAERTARKEAADLRAEMERKLDKARSTEERLRKDKTKADDARTAADRARDSLEALLYTQLVSQSQRAWNDHDPDLALALLEAGKPEAKRPDQRGWEWHYLRRLYRSPKTYTYRPEDPPPSEQFTVRSADGTDLRAYVLACSPDNATIALSLIDSRVTLLNTVFGTVSGRLDGHRGVICGVAYSPDGAKIATAAADRTARIWDARSGQALHTLRGHDDGVLGVAFSTDGERLLTTGADKKVVMWEVASGAKQREFTGHTAPVLRATFAPDGTWIATASADRTCRLWDAESGEVRATLSGHLGAVYDVAVSPDGKSVATAGGDRVVKLWGADGRETRTLKGHARAVRSVAFRPDGARLASVGEDRCLVIWDVNNGRGQHYFTGHGGPVRHVAYRSDGRQLATASVDQTIKLWDANRPVAHDGPAFAHHGRGVLALALSPDGTRLASAGADKNIRLTNAKTGEELRTWQPHDGLARALAFSKDGQWLATGGDDKLAKVWDVQTGQVLRTAGGHTKPVLAVAVSPDGTRFATGSADGSVRLRDTKDGQSLLTLHGQAAAVVGIAFSQNGKAVVTTAADGSARVWDVATGLETKSLLHQYDPARLVLPPGVKPRTTSPLGQGEYAPRVAYSPNGRRFAFSNRDGSVFLWDSAVLLPVQYLAGHDTEILLLAYSPDGRRLATADGEGTVKLWDVRTGLEVLRLTAHDSAVTGLAFTADGKVLFTAGADGDIKQWDGAPDEAAPKSPDELRQELKDRLGD